MFHFRVSDPDVRHRIGRLLAPVEPWGRWGEALELDGDPGGMTSLTMTQPSPGRAGRRGHVNVTVEPSVRIGDGQSGVYVRVNDHYALGSDDSEGRAQLLGFLERDFESSIKNSEGIVDRIMSLAADREG